MAVRTAARMIVIILMIALGNPKIGCRTNLCIHFIAFSAKNIHQFFNGCMLPVVCVEYSAPILRSDVCTLTIGLCSIVNLKKRLAKCLVVNLVWVILHKHCLNMVCFVGSDLVIGGISVRSTCISYQSPDHSALLVEIMLDTPKTTCCKYRHLMTLRHSMPHIITVHLFHCPHHRFNHLQSLAMLRLEVGKALTTGVIMTQVVVFYSDS